MKRSNRDSGNATADLEQLVAEITTDAHGDDEQLWAFHQALVDGVDLPCDAFVIGEPVSVIAFDYDGNRRRGIVARCRREDGSEHVVAASEVVLAPRSQGGPILAAYRKWLGLDPLPEPAAPPTRRKRQHKVAATDLDLSQPIEPIDEWAKPIIARGPRQAYEMEQVVPGRDPDDFDSDPICESNDLKDAGDGAAAYRILMELCQADLRCLDAHAHLGNFVFDHRPKDAIRHYEVGVRIGELSLPPDFEGLLPWGHIDNRPFMRCLHGYGLCLWRLERFEDAERVFDRMLWLNPSDNQGVRFLIDEVRARTAWEDREER